MKNMLKYMVCALSATTLLTGCIKETFPMGGSATADQVGESTFATENMLDVIPTAMLTAKISDAQCDFGYPGLMIALDQMCGEVFPTNAYRGGNERFNQFTVFTWHTAMSAEYVYPALFWYDNYGFIKSVNDIIIAVGDSSVNAPTRGMAKAYRALFYLDLARQYEALPAKAPLRPEYEAELAKLAGLTVPIIDENTVSDPGPRASREAMYKFILSDLNDAVDCLSNYTATTKKHPSLAVAYGLLARTYLWLGGYTETYNGLPTGEAAYKEAAKYARLAITAHGQAPMAKQDWLGPTGFTSSSTGSWMWCLIQAPETLLSNLENWAAMMSPEANWGYGGLQQYGVRKATYERMSDTDWRKEAIVGPNATYADFADKTNYPADAWNAFGLMEAKGAATYAQFKFHVGSGNISNWKIGSVVDIPLMRVEEMYLIEAEATAHYNAGEGEALLKAFMAYRDPSYTYSGTDLVEEIIFQKRVELWGEGLIFYDMKRLNMGINNGYEGTNTAVGARFVTEGRCPAWNICIPRAEVQQNPAMIGFNNPDPSDCILSNDPIAE